MGRRLPTGRLVAGIGLILLGVAVSVPMIVAGAMRAFDSLLRLPAPGSRELQLEPGRYTVFWETRGWGGSPKAADVDVRVAAKGQGPAVAVDKGGLATSRYSTMDGVRGVSIAAFTIDGGGVYVVSARASGATGGIAITREFGLAGVFRIIVIPLLLLFGCAIPGIMVLVRSSPAPASAG